MSEQKSKQESVLLEASEKQKEKILPKTDITTAIPPPTTLPPNTTKTNPVNSKDKMIWLDTKSNDDTTKTTIFTTITDKNKKKWTFSFSFFSPCSFII